MKKVRQAKNNDLRVEIQRLREELRKARLEAAVHAEGAAEMVTLTEQIIIAVMKACNIDEIEITPELRDTDTELHDTATELLWERTEKGFVVRLVTPAPTESDKNPDAEGV